MDGKDDTSPAKEWGAHPSPGRGGDQGRQMAFCVPQASSFTPLVLHLREILRKTSHFCGPGLSMECWRKNKKDRGRG